MRLFALFRCVWITEPLYRFVMAPYNIGSGTLNLIMNHYRVSGIPIEELRMMPTQRIWKNYSIHRKIYNERRFHFRIFNTIMIEFILVKTKWTFLIIGSNTKNIIHTVMISHSCSVSIGMALCSSETDAQISLNIQYLDRQLYKYSYFHIIIKVEKELKLNSFSTFIIYTIIFT